MPVTCSLHALMPVVGGVLRRVTSALVLRWLLFTAIFSLAAVPPLDPDLWWHLANGRLIITTGTISHVDPYSFSAAGQPWVMHEWLADLLMYLLNQLGGLPLLVAVFAGVVAAGAVCLYVILRRSTLHPTLAAVLTLVGALAGSTAWGARPQLLNLLFTGVLVVGGIIAGLFLIGEWFDARRSPATGMPARRRVLLGWAIAAGMLLSVVDPSGVQTLLFPLGTLTSPLIQNNIQEWASPDFHSMAGLMFEGLVFLVLGGLATGRVKARTHEWLWAFALLYLPLASQRNVPLFVIGAAPLAARCAQALLVTLSSILPAVARRPAAQAALRWTPIRPNRPTAALGVLNLALLVVAVAVMIAYRAVPNLRSADEAAAIASVFPVRAADALQAVGKPVRIFNYYDYGGYLLWRLYPHGSRIFIDGRVEVYGSVLFSRYLRVSYLADGWPSVIAQTDPDAIVLPSGHPLVGLLEQDPAWQLFSHDRVATVFTRVGFAP